MQSLSLRGRDAVDALNQLLAPLFPDIVVEPPRGAKDFAARFGFGRLNRVQILHGAYNHPLHFQMTNPRVFGHGFPVRGSSELINNGITMAATPDRGPIFEPGSLDLTCGSSFEQIVAFMNPDTLSASLTGLVGAPLPSSLRFVRTDSSPQREAPGVRRLVRLLTDELEDETSMISPVVIAEIEQAILVAYLCGTSHNFSTLLDRRPPDAASWQVRRLEDYIEANWDQPLSIEVIAIAANMSARSVFRSFRQRRGYSPTTYLKQVRLKKAREMLIRPGKDTSVTSVAFGCGFGNLGHFANDYRRVFGEAPSATLHRAKGGPLG